MQHETNKGVTVLETTKLPYPINTAKYPVELQNARDCFAYMIGAAEAAENEHSIKRGVKGINYIDSYVRANCESG